MTDKQEDTIKQLRNYISDLKKQYRLDVLYYRSLAKKAELRGVKESRAINNIIQILRRYKL